MDGTKLATWALGALIGMTMGGCAQHEPPGSTRTIVDAIPRPIVQPIHRYTCWRIGKPSPLDEYRIEHIDEGTRQIIASKGGRSVWLQQVGGALCIRGETRDA